MKIVDKEIIIKKEEDLLEPKQIEIFLCDECHVNFGTREQIFQCFICGKDICSECKTGLWFRTHINTTHIYDKHFCLCKEHQYDIKNIQKRFSDDFLPFMNKFIKRTDLVCDHDWKEYSSQDVIYLNQEECTKCSAIRSKGDFISTSTDTTTNITIR